MYQHPTLHSDPDFLTAHALFVAFDCRATERLVPDLLGAYLGLARCEFTDDGRHLPDRWLDLDITSPAEANAALRRLEQALDDLIASSAVLADTLRLLRTRDLIRDGQGHR